MAEISVIIPVYNVEKYLTECLNSLLAQTFTDWEAICVNDGSTDGCAAILQQHAKKDNRFKIIAQEKNQGLSSARNTGAAMATGKYLYFLDSDDWIEPELLKHCYEKAERHQTDILLFSHFAEYNVNCPEDSRFQQVYTGRDLLLLIRELNCWHAAMWIRFFRRDFYTGNRLQFQQGIYYEDFYMTMGSDLLAERAMFLPEKLYHYRNRKNSICHSQMLFQHFYSRWLCCKKLYGLLIKYHSEDMDLYHLFSDWLKNNMQLLKLHYLDLPRSEQDRVKNYPEMAEIYELLQIIDQDFLKINQLYFDIDCLQEKLDFLLNHSISYKIGKAITWLPQAIVHLLKGRKNG